MSSTLTSEDLYRSAERLAQSEEGRATLKSLLGWLNDGGGLVLDAVNQNAVLTLLTGAWGSMAGSARDAMNVALGVGE